MKAKVIIVRDGQTLVDIAIQEYGVFEGIFLVAFANTSKINSITQDLIAGMQLVIWDAALAFEVISQKSDELEDYLSVLTTWMGGVVGFGGSGGGGGSGLNDEDYVHIRGDEIVQGVKTFISGIETDNIEEAEEDSGVTVEGVMIKDGVLDAGNF